MFVNIILVCLRTILCFICYSNFFDRFLLVNKLEQIWLKNMFGLRYIYFIIFKKSLLKCKINRTRTSETFILTIHNNLVVFHQKSIILSVFHNACVYFYDCFILFFSISRAFPFSYLFLLREILEWKRMFVYLPQKLTHLLRSNALFAASCFVHK